MLRGFATTSYWADDVDAARRWYAELLGIELGLIDRRYAPADAAHGPGGAVMYWHVDDVEATFQRLLSMGAKEYQPITARESGFVTAAVVDPFWNVLGVMHNPHYLEVLGR